MREAVCGSEEWCVGVGVVCALVRWCLRVRCACGCAIELVDWCREKLVC